MATVQVESILEITVGRDTRDVLRNCLRAEAYRLEDFERVISDSDCHAAHEVLARAVHLVEMFDQLGWADDDPRDLYEITVARDSFVPWLRGLSSDLAESLADEIMLLLRIEAGDERLYWGGRTQQEMIVLTRGLVLSYRSELNSIEVLLECLSSAGAVT